MNIEPFAPFSLWPAPRDRPIQLSMSCVRHHVERSRSPPPTLSDHNVKVSAARLLTADEFFDKAVGALASVFLGRVRSRDYFPCPLLMALVDGPRVQGRKPHLDYDDVRLAGPCALCGYRTTHKHNVKSIDCTRCVNHLECADYMVKRAGWAVLYCVTRGVGVLPNGLKIECANRNDKGGEKRARDATAIEVKKVLGEVAQRFMHANAMCHIATVSSPVVMSAVVSMLERRYTVRVSSLRIDVYR